jgi:hypothetical protein
MFFPAENKKFKRGNKLLATDLNNIAERIERLEKVFSGNLLVYNGQNGINFNLPQNIPEVEFIELTENVEDDDTVLYTGLVLTQDIEGEFSTTSEELEFRNIFRCSFPSGRKGLVIRFPRGNGEWIIIPKACN